MIITLYVDELLIDSNNLFEMPQINPEFCKCFKMKEFSEANEFFCLRITRNGV